MQTQSKRWLGLAILMAVIFFAGLFFGQKKPLSPDSSDLAIQQTAAEPVGEFSEPGETDPQDAEKEILLLSSDGKSSYRVKAGKRKSGPARPPLDHAPRLDIDWENEFESLAVLESAIAGNEHDVIAVSELVLQCRGILPDVRNLERKLSRMSQKVKAGNPMPSVLIPGTGENVQFTNFVEFEEFQLTRFAECQATRHLFDNAMRQHLEEEARNGSVTARFLYAMWLPEQLESNQSGLIEWITYQGLAWDFTWANIREGEPLGLLAYGRSLEQSGSIYFTPRHYNYGPAFILASQKCGLQDQVIEQKVKNMTAFWNERKMTQRLNRVESLSDQIADMFCR